MNSKYLFSFDSVKNFLDFSDDFWNFVSSRVKFIDGSIEENKIFYATLMKFDDFDRLVDIKVVVPYIIDLETTLVNIHEFKHAYDLYYRIGMIIDNELEYERRAVALEKKFIKMFVK